MIRLGIWLTVAAASSLPLAEGAVGRFGRVKLADRIVPGVGIGKVSLGMSKAQVRAALGKPTAVGNDAPGGGVFWFYGKPVPVITPAGQRVIRVPLIVDFARRHGRVDLISTEDPRYRTAGGIGVGIPFKRVLALPGIRCDARGYYHGCDIKRITSTSGATDTAFLPSRTSDRGSHVAVITIQVGWPARDQMPTRGKQPGA